MSNYRPLSLISCFSKIIEKLVFIQLSEYIEYHGLGNISQSTYNLLYSVETVLLSLHSELLEVLERGNAAFLVFLDLSTAFDIVNHGLLLDILNSEYHVTVKALEWFK